MYMLIMMKIASVVVFQKILRKAFFSKKKYDHDFFLRRFNIHVKFCLHLHYFFCCLNKNVIAFVVVTSNYVNLW